MAERREPWRPQFHFTPAINWINDPNGLVFFDGEYHLFFQYNPFGDTWGHMSWGHAVSADLVHWHELPVAIAADDATMIFSGSVVVDEHNSAGFAGEGEVALVAIYTGAQRREGGLQCQEVAYSVDRGRSWTRYPGNPVLDIGRREFRDPKVFWHAAHARWVMVVALPDRHQVSIYTSTDLKRWQHLSDFGPAGSVDGIWECPDLFEVVVDDEPGRSAWVLKVDVGQGHVSGGSGAQYFVGAFDGVRFTPDANSSSSAIAPAQWVDFGSDFYAALSWSNLPAHDAGPVWLAWMSAHAYAAQTPTSPWRGAMSVPRRLSLRSTPSGLVLCQQAIAAMQRLRGQHWSWSDMALRDSERALDLPGGDGRAIEVIARFAAHSASEFGIKLRIGAGEATVVGFDCATQRVFVDRSQAGRSPAAAGFAGRRYARPVQPRHGVIELRILVDWSSVEVFVGGGEAVITELIFPSAGSDALSVYAIGGSVAVDAIEVWQLRSAHSGFSSAVNQGAP